MLLKLKLDLSSQGETKERFNPTGLSRNLVRFTISMSQMSDYILPESWQN